MPSCARNHGSARARAATAFATAAGGSLASRAPIMAAYAAAQKRSKTDNRLSSCSGSSPYRNAFFYAISTDALAREFPDPSPTHTEYWEFARENGLLAD